MVGQALDRLGAKAAGVQPHVPVGNASEVHAGTRGQHRLGIRQYGSQLALPAALAGLDKHQGRVLRVHQLRRTAGVG